ncbi:Protein BATH-38 [Aphelenchoides avenae]|nr:Protein BATH-38 [Aphelenchus avenae]
MSNNQPPNLPPDENTSKSGHGPRAKKAKTSDPKSSDGIARLHAYRGGSQKATLTLGVDDVFKLTTTKVIAKSDKTILSGISWWVTAEIVDGYLSVMLNGSHPSMSEWHCKVDFTMCESVDKKSDDDGIVVFTHKDSAWGYEKWMPVVDLLVDYVDWSVRCEMTTFNCYVTDGAFGCRSRFHDVTFDFGSRYLYANKGFLAANAEYFEAMFFGDFVDNNKDTITLKKVKADEFSEFVKALAPGPMPIIEKNVFTVLRMADRFQAHELVERCASFLLQDKWKIGLVNKLQVADELLMSRLRDNLIENASKSDLREASKMENESKFSKLTWIKLFREYIRRNHEYSNSESDSDA